jgi:IclR family transcriptional regulator, KDG regulon repressor
MSERRIQSVDRALRLLEALRLTAQPLGLKELSALTGLNPATAHLLLRTMAAHHYVEQDPQSREYELGLAIVEAGQRAGRHRALTPLVWPHARLVHEKSRETVFVRVERDGQVYSLFEFEGTQPVVARPGMVFRSELRRGYAFATGKVFLAGMPPSHLRELLGEPPYKAFTGKTMTNRDAVMRELELVRNRGYALDHEELIAGISCVAVPINGIDGHIAATMSTSVPTVTATEVRMQDLTLLLLDNAEAASARVRAAGLGS